VSRAPGLVLIVGTSAERWDAASPMAVNPVVLALVAALRDIERSRTRGTVRSPAETRRSAA
jgi:hypothetical protein